MLANSHSVSLNESLDDPHDFIDDSSRLSEASGLLKHAFFTKFNGFATAPSTIRLSHVLKLFTAVLEEFPQLYIPDDALLEFEMKMLGVDQEIHYDVVWNLFDGLILERSLSSNSFSASNQAENSLIQNFGIYLSSQPTEQPTEPTTNPITPKQHQLMLDSPNRPRTSQLLTEKLSKPRKSMTSFEDTSIDSDISFSDMDEAIANEPKVHSLLKRLKSCQNKLTAQKLESDDNLQNLQLKIDDLKLEIMNKNREVSQSKNEKKRLQETVDGLEKSVLHLNKELRRVKLKYDELSGLVDDKDGVIHEMDLTIDSLMKQLEESIAVNSKYEAQYENYLNEFHRLYEKAQAVELELLRVTQKSEQHEEENIQLRRQLEERYERMVNSAAASTAVADLTDKEVNISLDEELKDQSLSSPTASHKTLSDEDDLKKMQEGIDFTYYQAQNLQKELFEHVNELELDNTKLKSKINTLTSTIIETRHTIHELSQFQTEHSKMMTVLNRDTTSFEQCLRVARQELENKVRQVSEFQKLVESLRNEVAESKKREMKMVKESEDWKRREEILLREFSTLGVSKKNARDEQVQTDFDQTGKRRGGGYGIGMVLTLVSAVVFGSALLQAFSGPSTEVEYTRIRQRTDVDYLPVNKRMPGGWPRNASESDEPTIKNPPF